MPSAAELEKMKKDDTGFVEASKDAVSFMKARQPAIGKIAKYYHLDAEELSQEGYEILLTCLRDYTPVYQKPNGDVVKVMFTTFFSNRMESRAMELRNGNPEYQARQAFTDKLSDDERTRFREDPPLLVQHLDHDSPMQEHLASEVSEAKEEDTSLALRIVQDSFFDKVLNDLVVKEKDEKKKAALLHVKVGGVYNFQEMALLFGVTDSRASQVLNELMDAFYTQRMIDGDLTSIVRDLTRMKLNEKRGVRLLKEAMLNSSKERADAIVESFEEIYPSVKDAYADVITKLSSAPTGKKAISSAPKVAVSKSSKRKMKAASYNDVFTEEENEKYPLQGVELRDIDSLKLTDDFDFRAPDYNEKFNAYAEEYMFDDGTYPAIINEQGVVIDGNKRIRLALAEGRTDYMCIVRDVADEKECHVLSVMVNLRLLKPSKIDLYYAISALSDLGLSQQKMAGYVGTSRTNVLVYVKVKDKASAKTRALFEDGLIQVTNASTCAELPESVQDEMASFIRRYGQSWSKGAKFNELHHAAAQGELKEYIEKVAPTLREVAVDDAMPKADFSAKVPASVGSVDAKAMVAMKKRLEAYEQNITDSEVWAQRRESVITQQTEELQAAKEEIESLKKELEASELVKFSSPKVIEDELKKLKAFYDVSERMSGAKFALSGASKTLKNLMLTRKQNLELSALYEELEQALSVLRISMMNSADKK